MDRGDARTPSRREVRGLVLYHDGRTLFVSRGYRLYRSRDGGASLERLATLPRSSLREQLARTRLGQRLVRGYIRHLLPSGDALVALAGRRFFRLSVPSGELWDRDAKTVRGALRIEAGPFAAGRQPFHLASTEQGLYYGEYRSNPERAPVGVYRSGDGGMSFALHCRFAGVRHIHGVFADPWEPGTLLAATGDDDSESGIWRISEAGGERERIAGGSQRYRAVTLLPTERFIYFGSDSPRERNFLYRLDRGSGHLERLAEVGGSVFWGRRLADGSLAFSTVVEPSEVNTSRDAELWVSRDGEEFTCLGRYRADPLHPKLFQYSQIRFPAGPGAGGELWLTPFANWRHERSEALDLASEL